METVLPEQLWMPQSAPCATHERKRLSGSILFGITQAKDVICRDDLCDTSGGIILPVRRMLKVLWKHWVMLSNSANGLLRWSIPSPLACCQRLFWGLLLRWLASGRINGSRSLLLPLLPPILCRQRLWCRLVARSKPPCGGTPRRKVYGGRTTWA